MGTNFYRIVTEEEMLHKKLKLIRDIGDLDMTPSNIERGFKSYNDGSYINQSPWDKFNEGCSVHLGKRSAGWKFSWNFHDNKYYSNKEELLKFIRSGRVIDEYGEEQNIEEFIEMALNWGFPDGLEINEQYRVEMRRKGVGLFFDDPKYDDRIVDGLRVSYSTDFC